MSDDVPPQTGLPEEDEPRTRQHATKLHIDEVRGLIRHRRAIASRLNANPEAMRMLIVNPVLAFKDAGIELSPAVGNHVLHAIQYPPEVRTERTALEDELKSALGGSPRPNDAAWVARAVFDQLGVAPLQIGDAEPVYRSSFDAADLEAFQAMLPTRGVIAAPAAPPDSPPGAAPPRLPFEPKSLRLLDLDAPVPPLPAAATAPAELSLTELWFYKDASPTVRSLLRLGIIVNSGVAIFSSSEYRKIRDGESANLLVSWIAGATIPSRAK